MKLQIALVALLTFGLIGGANACSTVFGQVTDACTEEPIENARVVLSFLAEETYTDENGWYELIPDWPSWWDIYVSKSGYESIAEWIFISPDEATRQDFVMTPIRGCEPEPEPTPKKRSTSSRCDHCSFVHGLTRYYEEMFNGWYFEYTQECGIEFIRDEPPQNTRWRCTHKLEI